MKKINEKMLYVGTNYHPHDWDENRWIMDLDLMQKASFNIIRIGHLCWDSFEPSDGLFYFEWMDKVMDLCAEREISVFMDIPTRPAPVWLHKKYPSIDIVDRNGIRQNANTRYMEDVGDTHFREYAYRLAKKIAERYAGHKALLAFGLCNELGAGFCSYSDTAKRRFIDWLKKRYITIENLNAAWSTKRWSRKITSFDEIDFPIGGNVFGAPERYLDMRRFYSDEIISYIIGLRSVIKLAAPSVPVSTNHWSENMNVGFDYNSCYKKLVDFSGQGFYPGINPEDEDSFIGACFCQDHRMVEFTRPNWNLEFQTGSFGGYACPRKVMRMYAYLSYACGSQAVCAWTWRSMLGGEEQYLFGLLDHDGETTFKYDEFKQIAEEAKILNKKALLPRVKKAEAAIAYSFESSIVDHYSKDYYTTTHTDQVMSAYKALFHSNIDCNIIDLRKTEKKYKLVIIPGVCLVNDEMVSTIKKLLDDGSTVIMTAFSAKVNEHNQVFNTPLPGKLTEVFGIKIRGFDRAVTHVASINEGCLEKRNLAIRRSNVQIIMNGRDMNIDVGYHEFIELTTASQIASYSYTWQKNITAISCNQYGKGKAIYVGVPANESLICALIQKYCSSGLHSLNVPSGIVARELDNGSTLYINTTNKDISIPCTGYGIFTKRNYQDKITIPAYEVEIITPQNKLPA